MVCRNVTSPSFGSELYVSGGRYDEMDAFTVVIERFAARARRVKAKTGAVKTGRRVPITAIARRAVTLARRRDAMLARAASATIASTSWTPRARRTTPARRARRSRVWASGQKTSPVSPRRVVVGVGASAVLALGADFLGVTSKTLTAFAPEFARANRLDALYPVDGFTRCYAPRAGYEFIVPMTWLVDQTQASRNARRGVESLDPPALRAGRAREVNEPDAAYGPRGSSGEENASVITSAVPRGFDLAVFGDAEAQAEWLLSNVLAKPGSGKTGTLLSASQRKGSNGTTYYTFEYTIKTETWFRHNVAVFATRGSTLYTFVAQIPEERWPKMKDAFFAMAASFRVFVPSG